MRIYTVFIPPRSDGPNEPDPIGGAEAVKEGFSWPAFVLSVFWALWHGLWLAALLFFAANGILALILELLGADPLSAGAASLGLAAIICWTANDFRRAKLAARGFAEQAPVIAASAETAIRRYFESQPPGGGWIAQPGAGR